MRALTQLTLDPEQCYRVRDLAFSREDLKLFFNDGYLIFAKPVAGRRVAAVFVGDEEDEGDGEVLLLPPNADERSSLAKFTRTPNLDEHFDAAVLAFTDNTAEDLFREIAIGGRGQAPRNLATRIAQAGNPAVANLTGSVVQRIVVDLLSPQSTRSGFVMMTLHTERLGYFDVMYDPMADDQILAGQLAQRNGVVAYDVWTSFRSRGFRLGTQTALAAPFTVTAYRIAAALDDSLRLKATTSASFQVNTAPLRVMQFALSRAERVTGVKLDGGPAELLFQESDRSRALRANENDIFVVVAPAALAAGSTHTIEFEHEGQVIEDRGSGVYAVSARANWYPRVAMEFAQYDLEFRYPEQLTLVASGDLVEEHTENGIRVTRRRTSSPIRVAGFNLGQYARISKRVGDLTIDVYGNRGLDPALAPRPLTTIITQQVRPLYRGAVPTRQTETIVQTPSPPDPIARLEAVADDVAQAMTFYSDLFGATPLKSLTVSPLPGTSGQGFPGLIYLSTLSYLREEERPKGLRDARQQTFFTDLMVAHEVAHQWWGNLVASRGYQDEWMVEALAHYSSLLWLEKKRGRAALDAELSEYRQELLAPGSDGIAGGFGPLTWGYRLESSRNPDTWRLITYEKGSWVFHMLRSRIGEDRFKTLLKTLRQRYEFKTVSTGELQTLVREVGGSTVNAAGAAPPLSGDGVESFFNSWVRSTGIPDVRIRADRSGRAPQLQLSGIVSYQDSDDRKVGRDFETEVPLQIEFADGQQQIEWVDSSDQGERFDLTLAKNPTKITLVPQMTLATGR